MTYIKPTKYIDLLNVIIAGLVCGFLVGTFWIVVAYNKTVDLSHDIATEKTQLDAIGAQSTALNNSIIATLSGSQLTALASADNLVEEKTPQYFQITDQKWPIASQ
jgi:hypothetical protein